MERQSHKGLDKKTKLYKPMLFLVMSAGRADGETEIREALGMSKREG